MERWSRVLGVAAVAWLTVGCAAPDASEDNGYVRLRFLGTDGKPNLYPDTATVAVSMIYDQCGLDVYDADMAQDGVIGETVFDAWHDRLCAVDEGSLADCDVESIDQHLDRRPAGLDVVYATHDFNELQELAFGPIPLESLAGCVAEMTMDLASGRSRGLASDGSELWTVTSAQPISGEANNIARLNLRVTASE